MGNITADIMLAEMRYHMQDTDTTDQGLTDAQCYYEMNGAYHDFLAAFPDLLVAQVGSVTLTTGNYSYTLTATSDFRDLTTAIRSSGAAIERCNIEEALGLVNTMNTQSNVRSWAARRSNTNPLQWTIYVLPTPQAATPGSLTFYGHVQPADLTSGLTPLIGTAESRWVSRLAAIRGAAKLGRSQDYIDTLWRDLPQHIQDEFRVVEGAKRPYSTPSEQVT